MAHLYQRIGFAAWRYGYRTPARRKVLLLRPAAHTLHTTPVHNAPEDPSDVGDDDFKNLSKEIKDIYRNLDPDEQAKWREESDPSQDEKLSQITHMEPSLTSKMTSEGSLAANEALAAMPEFPEQPFRPENTRGFLAELEEDDQDDIGDDPEFRGDDITSEAHGELEQHRELREYARLIVWELPLLHKLAKPFEPPSDDTPLRFRYTTYLGESHPAARKVVCEFCTKDIATASDLTEPQRTKLIKLAGVRYNPDTDIVKMGSEKFETQAQNKRYLLDLIHTLIKEAKDPTDMFEDVPLDFRHHKPKKQWVFPEDWKLDAAKRQRLVEDRQKQAELEDGRRQVGDVVQGRLLLSKALENAIIPQQTSIGEQRRPRLR